ncbi:(2Fe-2S)-binding protein [Devosia sp. Root635]|uniref:(2Fe-2S)-binding protein n=1 Tax=Devosia sp. Root635 TaxID=1736575 RepID=UPI0006FD0D93|nr:(2Fe-2S)-binding protein [Devosia sp. Root635]KRA55930.1 hypothetical protein ASD80_01225 [Devosia sp. Root635]
MTAIDATDGLPLRQFLEPLQSAENLQLSIGADRAGHEPIVALPPAVVEAWLAAVSRDHADMEARTCAAYLIGDIAWAFGRNLAALHLAGPGLPDIGAGSIAAAPQWYRWEEDGEGGEALRFTLRLLAAPDATHRPLDIDGIRALAVAAHAPLIETLSGLTRLGRSAMWRLVADALAAGWLLVGKRIGLPEHAMRVANAIIGAPGSPLANKQTGFVEIVLRDETDPERVLGCEWFRARGGCCRYYTTGESAGEYCTTCVLRPPESRDQRLRDHLKARLQMPV